MIVQTIRRGTLVLAGLVLVAAAMPASAQDTRTPDNPYEWQGEFLLRRAQPSPAPQVNLAPSTRRARLGNGVGFTNTIVITGYWPPTNNMVRQWSNNPVQNPGGWIGENWEGRGYNIYAYFPEFAGPGPNWGRGTGDFEVDYQDTSNDWWSIIPAMEPIAIITFSRADFDFDWECEGGNRYYQASSWTPDYLAPTRPTPELPSFNEPHLNVRNSTLPMTAIVTAVNAEVPNLFAYQTSLDAGAFLSNYIGYHGCWYHALHASLDDPAWNVAAGHIHVGYAMSMVDAIEATEVSLRVLIDHVDAQVEPRLAGDVNCDFSIDFFDIDPFLTALFMPETYPTLYPDCNIMRADANADGGVDFFDIDAFVALIF